MNKRTWCYIEKPNIFCIKCPICNSENLAWSEYEHHIWCYNCEKDYNNYESIFDGPIPINTAIILGLNFDRYNIETKKLKNTIFQLKNMKLKYMNKELYC